MSEKNVGRNLNMWGCCGGMADTGAQRSTIVRILAQGEAAV